MEDIDNEKNVNHLNNSSSSISNSKMKSPKEDNSIMNSNSVSSGSLKNRSPSPLSEVIFTNTTPQKSLLNIPLPLTSSMTQLIRDSKLNHSIGDEEEDNISSNNKKTKRLPPQPFKLIKQQQQQQHNEYHNGYNNSNNNHHLDGDIDTPMTNSISSSPYNNSSDSDDSSGIQSQVVPNDCVSPFEFDHTNGTKLPLISPLICSPKLKSMIDSSIDENELTSIFKLQHSNNISNDNSNYDNGIKNNNSSSRNSNRINNSNSNSIETIELPNFSTNLNSNILTIATATTTSSSSTNPPPSSPSFTSTTTTSTTPTTRSRNNSLSGRHTPSRLNKTSSPIPFVLPTSVLNDTSTSINSNIKDNSGESSDSSSTTATTTASSSQSIASAIKNTDRWSFSTYISDEIHGDYMPVNVDDTMKREQVYNFVHVPWELEKLLSIGFLICLENFLYLFTFLPIRIIITFAKLFTLPFSKKHKLTNTQIYDIFRTLIWIISFAFLNLIDSSMVYHHIRGQAVIKLYIIYNVLEVLDKLCCSFGQDIFDSLYWMSVSLRSSKTTTSSGHTTPIKSASFSSVKLATSGQILAPFQHTIVCTLYVCVHSLILFTQVITLNVAINSYNNALLTLIMSNNFVELKGSVFKRFEKENLFQISCSDIVERYQIFIYLAIIFFQNLSDLNWDLSSEFLLNMCYVIASVWGSEVIVDAIKHAFITKFNKITPTIYSKFRIHLIDTILDTRNKSFSESSWSITSVIGFIPFPLATVVIRIFYRFLPPITGLYGVLIVVLIYLCLVCLKIMVKIIILGECIRFKRKSNLATTISPATTTGVIKKIA